jgi:hypothetical protein
MARRLASLAVALLFLVSCARLDINAIGLHKNVVKGGSAEIDQGLVVDVNGLEGIWIAGHRTTHGAVFNDIPSLNIGDEVCVYSHCYHVTRIIIQPDRHNPGYLGPVVLQTSWGNGVWLVVAA